MFERKKHCPVCGELAAVLDGDPDKYGSKAVPWNTFIRVKYCCDECRRIMKAQSTRLSNKRRRKEKRAEINVIITLQNELKAARERLDLLEYENRLSRQRIAELKEARL